MSNKQSKPDPQPDVLGQIEQEHDGRSVEFDVLECGHLYLRLPPEIGQLASPKNRMCAECGVGVPAIELREPKLPVPPTGYQWEMHFLEGVWEIALFEANSEETTQDKKYEDEEPLFAHFKQAS